MINIYINRIYINTYPLFFGCSSSGVFAVFAVFAPKHMERINFSLLFLLMGDAIVSGFYFLELVPHDAGPDIVHDQFALTRTFPSCLTSTALGAYQPRVRNATDRPGQ